MNIFEAMQAGTLVQIIGAHDCLSARIGASAGFDAIWASSLGLSTVAGRRDRNELSWTELVDAAGEIALAIDVPVILDGNEGYGHDENAKLMVRRAAQRGISGLSLEDKRFPKRNSHEFGVELLEAVDAARRVRCCCDEVNGRQFYIVARTDALVAGRVVSEAIDRAEAYSAAGASAVIVHSRSESFAEIESFMRQWSRSCPIIVIPTTYSHTPRSSYNRSGVGGLIWANQLIRSAILSMSFDARRLFDEGCSTSIDHHLASLADTFSLAGPLWRDRVGVAS